MAKIAGVEVETKLSLTGTLAFAAALIAMIGGWYKFDYRITSVETDVKTVEQVQTQQEQDNKHIADTLERTNRLLGQMEQALDDKGIHIIRTQNH